MLIQSDPLISIVKRLKPMIAKLEIPVIAMRWIGPNQQGFARGRVANIPYRRRCWDRRARPASHRHHARVASLGCSAQRCAHLKKNLHACPGHVCAGRAARACAKSAASRGGGAAGRSRISMDSFGRSAHPRDLGNFDARSALSFPDPWESQLPGCAMLAESESRNDPSASDLKFVGLKIASAPRAPFSPVVAVI